MARRWNSATAKMIFDVRTLVSYVSEFITLLPGDAIDSSTRPGVGQGESASVSEDGCIVELGIDGLGELRQDVVSRESLASHAH